MGQAARRRAKEHEESIMPLEIRQVFDETDIEKTWDYLHTTFRLNKAKWKADFEEEFRKSSRQYSKEELFIRFGKQHFEEPICILIYRKAFHSNTWMDLIKYIVRDKIMEKKREAEERYNRYRGKR